MMMTKDAPQNRAQTVPANVVNCPANPWRTVGETMWAAEGIGGSPGAKD